MLGMTIVDYQKQFKALADRLALEPLSQAALEDRVLRHLWVIGEDTGARARANRERRIERVLSIFSGRGDAGDTTGNSPGTKWTAFLSVLDQHGKDATEMTAAANDTFHLFSGWMRATLYKQ